MSSVSRIFPGLVSRGRQKAHSLLAERRERSSQRCGLALLFFIHFKDPH